MGDAPRASKRRRLEAAWERRLLQRLILAGAPRALLRLIWGLSQAFGLENPQHVQAFETFSGHQAVTRGHRRRGLRAVSFERNDHPAGSPQGDWLSDVGFTHALSVDIQLCDGAQSTNAPVCSSWTWVGRSQTGRRSFLPLGDPRVPTVAEGNIMVSRMVLHLFVLEARGCWWILEQPMSSLLEEHPRFQQFISSHVVWRYTLRMGAFGAETAKPHWLYSNKPWVREIDFHCSRWWHPALATAETTSFVLREDLSRATTGNKGTLKDSQHYPRAFGDAVAAVHLAHEAELRAANAAADAAASLLRVPEFEVAKRGEDPWEDAELSSVDEFLRS